MNPLKEAVKRVVYQLGYDIRKNPEQDEAAKAMTATMAAQGYETREAVPLLKTGDRCRACGSELLSLLDGAWSWREMTFRVARCEDCGTASSSPVPENEALAQLYATEFDYQWYRDHVSAKRKDAGIRLNEYLPLLGRRMLDYGGGIGYLSHRAQVLGLESVTFDPYEKDHSSAPTSRGAWDSVVASHVLEHSNNPKATVMSMKDFLKPGGRLILAVPNFAARGYREQGMAWVWAQPPMVHIFHFTEEGLRALLVRCGFTDIEASYHERWDANSEADIKQVERFRQFSRSWGWARQTRSLWSPLKRRLIAEQTTRARFAALARVMANGIGNHRDLAELQIVATGPALRRNES
jgi:SAM-dependent methyltransferase